MSGARWLDQALDGLPGQRRALTALSGAVRANLFSALEAFTESQDPQGAAEGVFGALAQGRTGAEALGAAAAVGALTQDRIPVVPPVTGDRFYRAVEGTVDRALAELQANPDSFRSVRHRLSLAASTLVRHYYWEAMRATFEGSAKSSGVEVRFMWVANIVAGNPCRTCLFLHGKSIGPGQQFPHGPEGSPRVFQRRLISPPRHPNCECCLVPYVVTLDRVDAPAPPSIPGPPVRVPTEEEDFYTAAEVRGLSGRIFAAIMAALAAVIGWFGRRVA